MSEPTQLQRTLRAVGDMQTAWRAVTAQGVLTEHRCRKCSALQFRAYLPAGAVVETKCWRCKTVNTYRC